MAHGLKRVPFYTELYVLIVNETVGDMNPVDSITTFKLYFGIDYVLLQHLVLFDREHSDKPRPNKLAKKIQKGATISGDAVVVPTVIISHSLVDVLFVL